MYAERTPLPCVAGGTRMFLLSILWLRNCACLHKVAAPMLLLKCLLDCIMAFAPITKSGQRSSQHWQTPCPTSQCWQTPCPTSRCWQTPCPTSNRKLTHQYHSCPVVPRYGSEPIGEIIDDAIDTLVNKIKVSPSSGEPYHIVRYDDHRKTAASDEEARADRERRETEARAEAALGKGQKGWKPPTHSTSHVLSYV